MNHKTLVAAVFDCNVYLQAAAREKSVAADCLRLVEQGLVRLYVSEEILAEVEEVFRSYLKVENASRSSKMTNNIAWRESLGIGVIKGLAR